MNFARTRQPSALIPIAMSLAALAATLIGGAISGPPHQAGVGTATRLWQILMAGQIPVVFFHAGKWLPRRPKTARRAIAAQLAAALAALAPVYWLGW